jgi:hypothetical protein
VDNSSELNKRENRSVTIILNIHGYAFNTVSETRRIIRDNLAPEPSKIEFDAKESITFNTKNGTYVKIPPYSLQDNKGRVITGKVELSIQEFIDYTDMFLSGITMNSNDSVLISDGFFDIKATKNNQPLFIRDQKNIRVIIKDSTIDNEIKYFSGLPDSTGNVNWNLSQGNKNGSIKSRTCRFDSDILYIEIPTKAENDSIKKILNILSLQENEDLTAQVIMNAFRNKDEAKLNRLITLLNIKNIHFGIYDSATYVTPKANHYLFKSSTQRELSFSDEVFKSIDFATANVISFDLADWESSDYLIQNNELNTIISGSQYELDIPGLRMINCDRYASIPNATTLAVKRTDNFQSTIVEVIIKSNKSIISGRMLDGQLTFPRLPQGEKAILISYAVWDGELYFSRKEITLGENPVENTMEMKSGSLAEFKSAFKI